MSRVSVELPELKVFYNWDEPKTLLLVISQVHSLIIIKKLIWNGSSPTHGLLKTSVFIITEI